MLLLVAGCKQVTSGTVTSREHHDAYTWYSQQCTYYDPKGSCSFYTMVPHYVPEEWDLCLRDDSEAATPLKDRDTGCVEVTESEWESYHPGDHCPRGQA